MMAEEKYVSAVVAGDYPAAARLFDILPYTAQEAASKVGSALLIEYKGDLLDRVLSRLAGILAEGIKGPWRVKLDGVPVLYGFDEFVVLSPTIRSDQREALSREGLFNL